MEEMYHPNQKILCNKIKKLYGTGGTILFPSGVAAIYFTFLTYIKNNTLFLIADELYCDTNIMLDFFKKNVSLCYKKFKAGDSEELLKIVNDFNTKNIIIFMEIMFKSKWKND